jgi:tRNA(Phe) wybutosine-synthesizing methylase Tyw3
MFVEKKKVRGEASSGRREKPMMNIAEQCGWRERKTFSKAKKLLVSLGKQKSLIRPHSALGKIRTKTDHLMTNSPAYAYYICSFVRLLMFILMGIKGPT